MYRSVVEGEGYVSPCRGRGNGGEGFLRRCGSVGNGDEVFLRRGEDSRWSGVNPRVEPMDSTHYTSFGFRPHRPL